MKAYSLSHLSDGTLLRNLDAITARDCRTTVDLLAHIAEVEARRLYAPAGYPSMFAYCVRKLRMSEDMAYKRIRAARKARRFPAVFEAISDGRLNLSGVVLLSAYLTQETADDLLAASVLKTNSEIQQLLAQRFPQPDMPVSVAPIPPARPAGELAARPVGVPMLAASGATSTPVAEKAAESITSASEPPAATPAAPAAELAVRPVDPSAPRPRVTPLAPERFGVQFTMSQSLHDKLREAQELLSHQMPSGDIPAVFELALDALLAKLRKAKFAATDRPRRSQSRVSEGSRHIPAEVRRAVRERDGGRCTFVSDTGHRCDARTLLEFDHMEPVARGGQATIGGIRLRCRAHNQYEAERVFGAGFMNARREAAARAG